MKPRRRPISRATRGPSDCCCKPSAQSCRYPSDLREGFATPLPHLGRIKTCALLLEGEAINQASPDRTDASTKALLAGIGLARSLENEPITISHLVEIACLAITFQGLEQALTRKAFAEDQLLNLQAALKEAESACLLPPGTHGGSLLRPGPLPIAAGATGQGLEPGRGEGPTLAGPGRLPENPRLSARLGLRARLFLQTVSAGGTALAATPRRRSARHRPRT